MGKRISKKRDLKIHMNKLQTGEAGGKAKQLQVHAQCIAAAMASRSAANASAVRCDANTVVFSERTAQREERGR